MFAAVEMFNNPETHAGGPLHAPVLIVPRIFEPEFCKQLIDYHTSDGGSVSGVMREIGGRTVPVVDDFKKRRDATIIDESLKGQIRGRITRRLLPKIQKALMFKVTRVERYIVARYDAEDGAISSLTAITPPKAPPTGNLPAQSISTPKNSRVAISGFRNFVGALIARRPAAQ